MEFVSEKAEGFPGLTSFGESKYLRVSKGAYYQGVSEHPHRNLNSLRDEQLTKVPEPTTLPHGYDRQGTSPHSFSKF